MHCIYQLISHQSRATGCALYISAHLSPIQRHWLCIVYTSSSLTNPEPLAVHCIYQLISYQSRATGCALYISAHLLPIQSHWLCIVYTSSSLTNPEPLAVHCIYSPIQSHWLCIVYTSSSLTNPEPVAVHCIYQLISYQSRASGIYQLISYQSRATGCALYNISAHLLPICICMMLKLQLFWDVVPIYSISRFSLRSMDGEIFSWRTYFAHDLI